MSQSRQQGPVTSTRPDSYSFSSGPPLRQHGRACLDMYGRQRAPDWSI
ncbi:unnamed protein product [Chondrus crispus]|uniref:Uncharacterized protein n=1 Tax=Chondrus crispus TaxID=2769 RepID=R7QGT4_CHOCR|nr:unnamed protein product [Chondrus crispus]CDF36625.1 unnamed protein product [Chondrus crispus]|eukprot:XP_005716444.1 unnamed protein product [Chondrus crispus]